MDHIPRHLQTSVLRTLDTFRVAVVHGPRQAGKTTLAKKIAADRGGTYTSLDDPRFLRPATADPYAFLTAYPKPLVIDEVQRGGDDLIRMVKEIVDAHPDRKGQFLLSGSSSFLTVPTLSESLAGRAIIHHLWPFSEAEIAGAPAPVIDGWFSSPEFLPQTGRDRQDGTSSRRDHLVRACRGGFPDVQETGQESRFAWFESYIDTVIQRDLRAFVDIRKADVLPGLLRWVCAVSGGRANVSGIAKRLRVDTSTIRAYLRWLQMVFLVHESPSWNRNLAGREVGSRKIYATDTGLMAAQFKLTPDSLMEPTATETGKLVETFVVNEITRQASAASVGFKTYYYRDGSKREVDMILEGPGGALIAVEVKASSSPHPKGARRLEWLRDQIDGKAPGAFRAGYLLHTGNQRITLGDRVHIRPIRDLWRHEAEQMTLT